MGICRNQLKYITDNVLPNSLGKKMLELGDQVLNPVIREELECSTGKELYTKWGYDHTSFDTNGLNGALKVDIRKRHPIYNNQFNIITDHGTIEHVVDQYNTFKNLHDWGNTGCLYVHVVPLDSREHKKLLGRPFPPHGDYEYSSEFWKELCKLCKYEIINITNQVTNMAIHNPLNHYSSCVYKKTSESVFPLKNNFDELIKKYTLRYHKALKLYPM